MIELLVSAAVTALAAPIVRRAMLRQGLIDVPNHRSSHSVPTPRGGGLACAAGTATGLAVAATAGRWVPWQVVAAVVIVAAVGLVDDHRDVPPVPRLAVQVVVGAALGLGLGGAVGLLVGVLVFTVGVNSVNFMDGINGITGLTMAVWGAGAMLAGHVGDVPSLVTLGAVTTGAALGFLPSNLVRARLFLGDVGSYLFGGLAGTGILLAVVEGGPVALVLAPLGLYVADVSVTLLRRTRSGSPLLEAHRDHVYQRLTAGAGIPHIVVALGVGCVSALLTLAWLIPEAWVSAGLTVLLLGLYLALPSLVARWRAAVVRMGP